MILYTLYFILGLCVGSFLNAVIWRLGPTRSLPLVRGGSGRGWTRSHCPQCRHKLAWHDLIPVISFIWLRGKCRYCKKPISWQYPLVEIGTGVIFLLIFNFSARGGSALGGQFSITNYKLLISFIYYLYIASILIIIFVYDLKHYLIPDKILFPAVGITIFYRIWEFVNLNSGHLLEIEIWKLEIISPYILSALGASFFFLFLILISKGKWMGMGDVKLAFLMGLILGWPNILLALFLAFTLGAVVGLALVSQGKKTLKSQVPFGPFLIAGTFIALFWGFKIIEWYLGLILL